MNMQALYFSAFVAVAIGILQSPIMWLIDFAVFRSVKSAFRMAFISAIIVALAVWILGYDVMKNFDPS